MSEPRVTDILATASGVEVLLKADTELKTKNYSVRIGHSGHTYGIDCEFAMETYRSRTGRGLPAICRRHVKRSTPLFAKLEAIAKVAVIKELDAAKAKS